jgi:hypothetical protein
MDATQHRFEVATAARTRNRFAHLWIWLFIGPLAVDYKAADANDTHIAQILLVAPALIGGILLVLIGPRFAPADRSRTAVTLALMLTVPASVVTEVLQQNPVGQYIRVLLPFVLFQLGFAAACRPWQADRLQWFEKAMLWTNACSLVFTLAYGMTIGGPLDDVRYRIVSPTLLPLQAALLYEFVVAKRYTVYTLGLFLLTVTVELLSVTRSLLVATALLFALAVWMSAPSARHLVRASVRMMLAALVVAAAVASLIAIFPNVGGHWVQRLTYAQQNSSAHIDPTTITRLAEIRDQLDQVLSSPVTIATGLGYGHSYSYSPIYISDLAGQISSKAFYATHAWAAGHNFWAYQLFAGGLLFGVALPAVLLVLLIRCMRAYRRWQIIMPYATWLPAFGRAILMTAALPAASIGGNPLGPRLSALILGVSFGLMVALQARLRRMQPATSR